MNAQPSPTPPPAENTIPAMPVAVTDLFAKIDRLIKAAATRQLTKDPLFELTPEPLTQPVEGLRLRWYAQRRELIDSFELRLRKALKGRGLTGQTFLAGQLAECWASLAEMGYNVDFLFWLDQAYGIRITLIETDLSEAYRREQQDIARERDTRAAANPPAPVTPLRRAVQDMTGIDVAPSTQHGGNRHPGNPHGKHLPQQQRPLRPDQRGDSGSSGTPPKGPDPRRN